MIAVVGLARYRLSSSRSKNAAAKRSTSCIVAYACPCNGAYAARMSTNVHCIVPLLDHLVPKDHFYCQVGHS